MNHQLLDNFLLDISNFQKATEDNSIKYYKSSEEHVKKFFYKELKLVCGVSKSEGELLNKFSAELRKIVQDLIIGDDVEKSLFEYTNIESKIEKEVPSNLYLCAKQIALSVKALYYYKNKNWDKALAITLECNALNDYLVQQGLHSLASRVFEQNKNIHSIFLRDKKVDSAYSLLFNLFNYLFNGINNNLYGNFFKNNSLWEKVLISREVYIYQMFVEIVEETVRYNFYNNDCFLPSKWYLNLKFKVDNTNRQVISDWIYINKQLRENNQREFFIALTNFLSQPISSHYDILKISLIIELNKLIQNSDYSSKELLLDKISFYLKEKLNGHTRIREVMIKKLNKQVRVGV
jgi:hypothetical protein